jgi:hypothetical protein
LIGREIVFPSSKDRVVTGASMDTHGDEDGDRMRGRISSFSNTLALLGDAGEYAAAKGPSILPKSA